MVYLFLTRVWFLPFRHSVEQVLLIEDFLATTIFMDLGAIGGLYVDIESLFGALVRSENLRTSRIRIHSKVFDEMSQWLCRTVLELGAVRA